MSKFYKYYEEAASEISYRVRNIKNTINKTDNFNQ